MKNRKLRRKPQRKAHHSARKPSLEFLERRHMLSASPELVADLDTTLVRAVDYGFADVNGIAYFTANDIQTGVNQLWKSDGTVAGTVQVTTALPADPGYLTLTNVGGTLFFATDDGSLWKSGGTAASTTLIKTISSRAGISSLTDINGTAFFIANDGSSGFELWRSDGTSAGTYRVKDIYAGTNSSLSSAKLVNVGGTVYFSANDGTSGEELWKSDGTEAGTVRVKDIYSGSLSSQPKYLTSFGGSLYFSANDGVAGAELWKSDGTELGTTLVTDISPGASSSSPEQFAIVGQTLFFSANDGTSGFELWKMDGSSGTVSLVADIKPGSGNSYVFAPTNVGGTLFFQANDGTAGYELWKSDGTATGTTLVKDIRIGSADSKPSLLNNVGGTLYFRANDGTAGRELWKSDGTATGTVLVKDIKAGIDDGLPLGFIIPDTAFIHSAGGTVFMRANDGTSGLELWKSDGTSSGTTPLTDTPNANNGTSFDLRTKVGNNIFFSTGTDLWKTDGTGTGTTHLKTFSQGSFVSGLSDFTNFNGNLYFLANDGTTGMDLWKSDGTVAGTVLVKDVAYVGTTTDLTGLTVAGSNLLFGATNKYSGNTSWELWKSDGTTSGTVLVTNLGGTSSFAPYNSLLGFTTANGILFYWLNDFTYGPRTWRSDGTSAGTYVLQSGRFSGGADVNGTLYFSKNNAGGYELWKSDGTVAGTVQVADINPSSAGSSPSSLTNVGGTLFFTADDGTTGTELWKSDGTAIGTVRVKDINPGANNSSLSFLGNVGGTLYFAANDGMNGSELWSTDGTEAGTHLVADIYPGPTGSAPSSGIAIDNRFYFTANDGSHGSELWQTDGTLPGTQRVTDIWPGAAGSSPGTLGNFGQTLLLSANDGFHGNELWKLDTTPRAVGDYDTNGSVDAADYVLWRSTLGSTTNLQANGDNTGPSAGIIDQADYTVWRNNFGGFLDDYGNGSVDASSISVPGTKAGSIQSSTDVDWFRFTATAGLTHRFQVNLSGLPAVLLRLIDTDGITPLLDTFSFGAPAIINWTPSVGGTYYLEVDAGGLTGDYSLVVSRDDYGDTVALATTVAIPSTTSGNIQSSSDVDWFRFTATAGSKYDLASTPGTLTNTVLRLIDTDGTTQLVSDNNGGAGAISWTAPAAGNYYLEVSGLSGTMGTYALSVQLGDDYGNSAATATAVAIPSTTSGTITPSGDSDWFSFSAVSGTIYRFETLTGGTLSDTTITLYGTDGTTQIGFDDDTGSGYLSLLDWTAPASGTYYFAVRGYSTNTGTYTLSVQLVDDHGNSAATATAVAVPSTTSGAIAPSGDSDWFRFTATAGTNYVFASTPGTLTNTVLRLIDTDGTTQLASDNNGGAGAISWTAPAAGNYYLEVSGLSGTTGTYTLSVQVDDHGNSAPFATAVAVPSTTSGTITPSGDRDWFSFSAVSGMIYRFETLTGGTLSDTTITLYGTDGTTQIGFDDDTGSGSLSLLGWTAPASGTYYVAVRGYSTNTGTYTLSVSVQVDDHGNSAPFATAVAVPSTTSGLIDTGSDRDWFSFAAVAGKNYHFETIAGTLTDTELTLYSTDGTTQLAYDDESGPGSLSLINWTASASGTYYIVVDSYSSYTGTYQLKVSSPVFSEAISNATVRPSGPRTGTTGQAYFNIEGASYGTNASYGVARFDSAAIKASLDSSFGVGGWSISTIDLVMTQSNAAFSTAGPVNVMFTNDDAVSIVPGSSPLAFPYNDGEFADAILVSGYTFTPVLTGTVDTYRIFDSTLSNSAGSLSMKSDLLNDSTMTLLFVDGTTTSAATYAGITHTTYAGPTLVVSAVPAMGNGALHANGDISGASAAVIDQSAYDLWPSDLGNISSAPGDGATQVAANTYAAPVAAVSATMTSQKTSAKSLPVRPVGRFDFASSDENALLAVRDLGFSELSAVKSVDASVDHFDCVSIDSAVMDEAFADHSVATQIAKVKPRSFGQLAGRRR